MHQFGQSQVQARFWGTTILKSLVCLKSCSRLFWSGAALVPALACATVRYALQPDLATKSFVVSIRVDHPGQYEDFQIPGWSPGFYVMQKFETNVSDVHASDGSGATLPVSHSDSRTWRVTSVGQKPVVISYRVAGNDVGLGFFGASVKSNEAYTNGSASFMYDTSRKTEDTALELKLPEGWKAATTLKHEAEGEYTASNYDELVDDPIQMGEFVDRKFQVKGIPFDAVFVAPAGEKLKINVDQTAEVLAKVSGAAIELFRGAPFTHYIYFFHLTPAGFQGGLEHRSGTVIAIPNRDDNDLSDLAAHEFFHAWNVKQIRPDLLGPFDYTSPQRTGNLWFAEGVTDYYAKILTYRSGVHDVNWLLNELSDQVATYQAGRNRLKNTIEDASRQVWENSGFSLGDLDYYNKGLLAGLLFDVKSVK